MKFEIAILVSLLLVCDGATVFGVQSCSQDSDCGQNRCCRPMYGVFGLSNCGELIPIEGERCGGQSLCGCEPGLQCMEDPASTIFSRLRRGNGTCVIPIKP